MSEEIRIAKLVFEIECEGNIKIADELAKKALALASIYRGEDGSPTWMHPIEDGSSVIRVDISDLVMRIPDTDDTSSN